MSTKLGEGSREQKCIWIDLDNSPHVPFFAPIIEELEKRGYSVLVTARDAFQVRELVNLWNLNCRIIGHHSGKNPILKLAGLCMRSLQLAPAILQRKPHLAVSHGSRSQLILATLLRIPSIVIMDYEFARGLTGLQPKWVMVPEVIAKNGVIGTTSHIMDYPGIKEDVYVPRFKPDSSIKGFLGLNDGDLVVTLRPPANEAHYHNPESETLLDTVLSLLRETSNTKVVLLPRNHKQEAAIRESWQDLFASGKVIVPPKAVDGLNLIWHSDLVISGGGTMNREAAALGIPVYSIFRGRIGAVDRELARTGRLVLIESVQEVRSKIKLQHRNRTQELGNRNVAVLNKIVENIETGVAGVSSRAMAAPVVAH